MPDDRPDLDPQPNVEDEAWIRALQALWDAATYYVGRHRRPADRREG